MHKSIFEMIYASNGGFTHSDLYTMPVYLRNFYYKQLSDTITKRNKQMDAHEAAAREEGAKNKRRFKPGSTPKVAPNTPKRKT